MQLQSFQRHLYGAAPPSWHFSHCRIAICNTVYIVRRKNEDLIGSLQRCNVGQKAQLGDRAEDSTTTTTNIYVRICAISAKY